jgi:hypothetical protein
MLIAAAAVIGALLVLPRVAGAADGDLWLYGTTGTGDQQHLVMAGTSPSIAALAGGSDAVAYQDSAGTLGTLGSASTSGDELGMAPGTSPAIAALTQGSWEIAFQSDGNLLWTIGGDGWKSWGLGMMPGTSPAITGLADGGYETDFQGPAPGYIWTAGTADTTDNLRGLDSRSSPGITAQGTSYEMAFEANTDILFTASPGNYVASQFGMSGSTSPSITALSGGGYEYAFEANGTDHLWTYGTLEGGDTGLTMADATSPSIAGLAHGGYEIAYQGANGDLSMDGSANTGDTGLAMAPGTSPSVAALPGGGYEVAFQAKPAPPAPVVTTPVPTPIPVTPAAGGRRLRVKLLLSWTWNSSLTRLANVKVGRHPRDTTIWLQCQGRGCPRALSRGQRFRETRRLGRAIAGDRFRPGDRLFIRVTATGYTAERVEIVIRRDTLPAVNVP